MMAPAAVIIALDKAGKHAGMSTRPGATYIYQDVDMGDFQEVERKPVVIPRRWAGRPRN